MDEISSRFQRRDFRFTVAEISASRFDVDAYAVWHYMTAHDIIYFSAAAKDLSPIISRNTGHAAWSCQSMALMP